MLQYNGEEGILVAGGGEEISSVEFYSPAKNSWEFIGALTSPRARHKHYVCQLCRLILILPVVPHNVAVRFSLTVVGELLVAAGGEPGYSTTIETLNTTQWVETEAGLQQGRYAHSAVSLPAEFLSCYAKMSSS